MAVNTLVAITFSLFIYLPVAQSPADDVELIQKRIEVEPSLQLDQESDASTRTKAQRRVQTGVKVGEGADEEPELMETLVTDLQTRVDVEKGDEEPEPTESLVADHIAVDTNEPLTGENALDANIAMVGVADVEEANCWSSRLNAIYIQEQHGRTDECYDFATAKQKCEQAADCYAIPTQSNVCGGKYRVTHGGPTKVFYSGDWKAYKIWAYTLNRVCLNLQPESSEECLSKCSSITYWRPAFRNCKERCWYETTTLPIVIEAVDCENECFKKYDSWQQSAIKKRALLACGKLCRTKAQSLYITGKLKIPEWRLAWGACVYNKTFTGSKPSQRIGKSGCMSEMMSYASSVGFGGYCWPSWQHCGDASKGLACCYSVRSPKGGGLTKSGAVCHGFENTANDWGNTMTCKAVAFNGQGRNDCMNQCHSSLPVDIQVEEADCSLKCQTDVPASLSSNGKKTHTYACQKSCLGTVMRAQLKKEEAKKALGNLIGNGTDGGGGGASSEALQNLGIKLTAMVQDEIKKLKELRNQDMIALRRAMRGLVDSQRASEEYVRQSGGSGITVTRGYRTGSAPYTTDSYANGYSYMAMHNHANADMMGGLGEFAAVMNGVTFRSRHNDYSINKPCSTSTAYHCAESITKPGVPPSVINKLSMQEQVVEMREYFKAFNDQNTTHRDYRPYFKPVLCYVEGAWENMASDVLVEPFSSPRHHIAASDMLDLLEKKYFYDYSGGMDLKQNIPFMPITMLGVDTTTNDDGTTEFMPRMGKWSYRVMCHPVDGDVETVRLNVVQDSHTLIQKSMRFDDPALHLKRWARFSVDPRLSLSEVKSSKRDVSATRNYLDLLMEQVPGKDNYAADIRDEINFLKTHRLESYKADDPARERHGTAINKQHTAGDLNTGYYHRYYMYGAGKFDGQGAIQGKRGFSDSNLWMAMTTNTEVANMSMTYDAATSTNIKAGETCKKADGTACQRVSQRWTYAFPLEIIYLTPLHVWNPHEIKEESGGSGTEADPYKGTETWTSQAQVRTPAEFYGSCKEAIGKDSADTSGTRALYVLDKDGVKRKTVESGVWIISPCIPGVGQVRTRYPIAPLHEESSSTWKELKALEKLVRDRVVPDPEPEPEPKPELVDLQLTGGSADHQHEVELTASQVKKLRAGEDVRVTTNLAESHSHNLRISAVENTQDTSSHALMYILDQCGQKANACADGHTTLIFESSTLPTSG